MANLLPAAPIAAYPVVIAGPPGPPGPGGPSGGPTGPAGPMGPAGVGPTGPSGVGATGPTGGSIGVIGPTGATGPAGIAGGAGTVGATGPTGAQGTAGSAGSIGVTGPAGPTGSQGTAGTSGGVGATGPTGSQGTAGTSGGVGATGPAGTVGVATASAPLVLTGSALSLNLDSTMRVNGSALGIANNVVLPGNVSIPATTASTTPATGALTVGGGLGVGGAINANEIHFTGNNNKTYSDGTNYLIRTSGGFYVQDFAGANTYLGAASGGVGVYSNTASTSTTTGALTVAGGMGVAESISVGASAVASIGTAVRIAFAGGVSQYGMSFRPAADNTIAVYFANAANGGIGNIGITPSATSYNTSSDGRLKKDFDPAFDAGPVIDALKIYDFSWKATGERSLGVVAQEAIEVFPQAVTHDEEHDNWGTDYSKFVPLLLQELKALRARVAMLEAKKG